MKILLVALKGCYGLKARDPSLPSGLYQINGSTAGIENLVALLCCHGSLPGWILGFSGTPMRTLVGSRTKVKLLVGGEWIIELPPKGNRIGLNIASATKQGLSEHIHLDLMKLLQSTVSTMSAQKLPAILCNLSHKAYANNMHILHCLIYNGKFLS